MGSFFKKVGRKGSEFLRKTMDSQRPSAPEVVNDGATMSNVAMFNVVRNPTFEEGTCWWWGLGCLIAVKDQNGRRLCVAHGRTEAWQGVAQEVKDVLVVDVEYHFEAWVSISSRGGETQAPVTATLKVETDSEGTKYHWIGSLTATRGQWNLLTGKVKVSEVGKSVVLYIEGPPSGVEVLVSSVALIPTTPVKMATDRHFSNQSSEPASSPAFMGQPSRDLLLNSAFEKELRPWTPKGCNAYTTRSLGDIYPATGDYFAVATGRTESWQGIQQDITGRIEESTLYHVKALVRLNGNVEVARVLATAYMTREDGKDQYLTLGSVNATTTSWCELTGQFLVNKLPKRASIYLEGPAGGVDILFDNVLCSVPKRVPVEGPVKFENPRFGVNIVHNSNFEGGLKHWYPQGSCRLHVTSGSPTFLGACAAQSFVNSQVPSLSGAYLTCTGRSYVWEGPAQTLTDRLQLNMTYQVSAWVAARSSDQSGVKHKVDVCLSVDGTWVQGGEVMAGDSWIEVVGSFRLEKEYEKVHVYLQGPGAGVDMMLGGLHIFAVNRLARVPYLREKAEKIRKRDVILKLQDAEGKPLAAGTKVVLRQTCNSFPVGGAISHYNLENKAYRKFFLEAFNWAVFENELKWGWTEPSRNQFRYKEADDLLEFCEKNNIPCRGHCIMWETVDTVQDWLQCLPPTELSEAVHRRITGLLSRYRGKFKHYDVNNEMLHGSFYRDRLGPQFLPYVFQLAHQSDPEAALFVNDYHIEDGCDCRSSPQAYIEHIVHLIRNGAPVKGIGIQGHITAPVGPIILNALDQLAVLDLPVWFTEIDVESVNEFTRAEDLEVLIREAFAHPSVEGIVLWGFWEGTMSRQNAQLVDSDKRVNEAGRRLLSLREEWKTSLDGHLNGDGEFMFRGFLGDYIIMVEEFGVTQSFELGKGDGVAVIDVKFS